MRRSVLWLLCAAISIVSLLCVILPFIWISPFRPQTAEVLRKGYDVRHVTPLITSICSVVIAVLAFVLWKRIRRLGRIFVCVLVAVTFFTAWFSRQNYFEWFFHPLMHPGYVSAERVNFLAGSDMVLALRINNDAVAYPVRLLAYHHIVNDVVGGTPVAATY
jgi:Protein of unknown function (DUF3179)